MSSKPISEYDAKRISFSYFESSAIIDTHPIQSHDTNSDKSQIDFTKENLKWLGTSKLVAKADQIIKRRSKLGLVALDLNLNEVFKWIEQKTKKDIKVGGAEGKIQKFLIEPFFAHSSEAEMYLSITSERFGERIMFHQNGGVDIGDIDKKANKMDVLISDNPKNNEVSKILLKNIENIEMKEVLNKFVIELFEFYRQLHFTYLEINPFVVHKNPTNYKIRMLDMAAKLDSAAMFQCARHWLGVSFPSPFGKDRCVEEKLVADLDSKTGSSLKLTVLNRKGRIWTLVAGGGASVIFTDTILALSKDPSELGNYGEYSGAPTRSLTYQYARTVFGLMTKHKSEKGKALLIGGGIANFTNVAETFDGIIMAIREFKEEFVKQKISVFVRRAGPNYQEGLQKMKAAGNELKIPIKVFGPEKGLTSIVPVALKELRLLKDKKSADKKLGSQRLHKNRSGERLDKNARNGVENKQSVSNEPEQITRGAEKFHWTSSSLSLVYGMQPSAVQNMLDFDYLSKRAPSVCCIVYPFAVAFHYRQFFLGSEEILLPVYNNLPEAMEKHGDVEIAVNFASSRSVLNSTLEMMEFPQLHSVGVIAEGVPEQHTKRLIFEARRRGVVLIGPATVGMIKPGCFRMGNTGGNTDNIMALGLYQSGSVGYVSRSGGLSNELNNVIAQKCDGVFEGVAIGGDRYPASTFLDILRRFESAERCRVMVLLGEVGGTLELEVAAALRSGEFKKPLVAWCSGGSAERFAFDVQFGHAGACAGSERETASAKNAALTAAGAYVPGSFEDFPDLLESVFEGVLGSKSIAKENTPPPPIPMDFEWAKRLGLVRKQRSFISTICFEKEGEPTYAGVPLTEVLNRRLGIGGAIGLLWFKKMLPDYMCRFFEMVLVVIADHGPAVSAAHNAIVTARAGKDVISALISGLVTIGPRFGGALDGAAKVFSWGLKENLLPEEFVDRMRAEKRLIMGIGHKSKSLENPDGRVAIISNFCREHFSSNTTLDYAEAVAKVTTRKKSNLILNIDGAIGVCFADCLRSCGLFSPAEVDQYIELGCINALFVLGRSVGLIGHYLDQNRLQQPLYRHDEGDISVLQSVAGNYVREE